MCSRGSKSSVAYFAHDPAHGRLLPASGAGDGDGGDDEFTCGGCLVAGAGPRYTCGHPGCGFTVHEACALRSPRTLRSALHQQHRLRRRREGPGSDGGASACACDVCGEDVKGACYACAAPACVAAGGVLVHPLCARMPGSARGGGGGHEHEAWLVRVAPAPAPAPGAGEGEGEKKAAAGCAACGRPVGAWRYRCVTCGAELHPRCMVPAADQCRADAGGGEEESVAMCCFCGLLHDVTRCLATMGTALQYRGYYSG